MDTWLKELRFATRQLGKFPGYAAAAAVTVALGISTISSVYSVADAVLLKPLPYRAPERLARWRLSSSRWKSGTRIAATFDLCFSSGAE